MKKPFLTKKVIDGLGTIAGYIESDWGVGGLWDELVDKTPDPRIVAALEWIREMQDYRKQLRPSKTK